MKRWLFLVYMLIVSCVHKPEVTIVPIKTKPLCDSTEVGYSQDIKPIFSSNCYTCHSTAATANGGLDLEDTTSLRKYLQYGFRGDNIFGSKLYHCLLHSSSAQQMPPGYIIDTCSLHKIHYWLSIGAPFTK